MAPRKMQIAAAGLGRMGKRHATNFLNRTPRAELVAAFTPDPEELAWARENLEPHGVTLYDDYDQMISQKGLDAVVIGTATSVHAEEAIKAMEKNLHVLCEKPLSTSVEVCQQVVDAAKKRPHLKVMCGFSRRFDESYRYAYEKMEAGLIGNPVILRSQTCDKHDPGGFFIDYAAWSGGCFVDMAVHDIDLTLWFFQPKNRSLQVYKDYEGKPATPPTASNTLTPKAISAHGIRGVHSALAQHKDYDNAVGIVEFWGGKIAYYYCSRMMAHGQEDTTEVIGTEGKLSVNAAPQANHVQQYTPAGITREIPAHYYGRFEYAFVKEANDFTAAVLDDTEVPMDIDNAVKAVQIGAWLQEALVSGKQIRFDESGNRIERATL